jgi:sugar/nucleoside kinase (ribokinase family)
VHHVFEGPPLRAFRLSVAAVSAPLLSVLCAGIVVADLFVPPLRSLPAGGELRVTGDFLLAPGGCAANTAIVLSRLGIDVGVAGKVGDDVFGEFLEEDLRRRDIDTRGLGRSSTHRTSKTVALTVIGEDRRFVHTLGANADFGAADIDPSLVAGAKAFYLGGYFVLPGLDGRELGDLFASARAAGVLTILDVVVPSGDEGISLDLLADVLPHVDLFVPNEDEARALTGEADPDSQAQRLREAGAAAVVVTMGPGGALLVDDERSLRVQAPKIEVVDASGAGDAFSAGLIAGYLEGWELGRTLGFASVLGASACTQLGCTDGVFDRHEAEHFLAGCSLVD